MAIVVVECFYCSGNEFNSSTDTGSNPGNDTRTNPSNDNSANPYTDTDATFIADAGARDYGDLCGSA